jgi:hypothetical protein
LSILCIDSMKTTLLCRNVLAQKGMTESNRLKGETQQQSPSVLILLGLCRIPSAWI